MWQSPLYSDGLKTKKHEQPSLIYAAWRYMSKTIEACLKEIEILK